MRWALMLPAAVVLWRLWEWWREARAEKEEVGS
jgi:hypothetical protein